MLQNSCPDVAALLVDYSNTNSNPDPNHSPGNPSTNIPGGSVPLQCRAVNLQRLWPFNKNNSRSSSL